MAVTVSNPGPMSISSLLIKETPVTQQQRSMNLPQIEQHPSYLEEGLKPISMLQPDDRSPGLSPTVTEKKRFDQDTECAPVLSASRQKYSEEECYFLWHQRVVLQRNWHNIFEKFNSQFANRQRHSANRQRRTAKRYDYGGIREKCSRFKTEKKLPGFQDRTNSSLNDKDFTESCTDVWYSWMETLPM